MAAIEDILQQAGQEIIEALGIELVAQGHRASGALIDTMYSQVADVPDGKAVDVFAQNYSIYVERGRRPGKWVPIDALIRWVQIKGIGSGDPKKEKAIAWAINTNIRKFGIPTPGSMQFTTNGKRTDFVQDTLNRVSEQIASEIAKAQSEFIMSRISNAITADI